MRWRLFTLVCGLSLLLWLATITILTRSYRVSDGWAFAVRPAVGPETDTSTREWVVRRQIIVSKGAVQYSSNEFPQRNESDRRRPDPVGYQKPRGIIAAPGWIARLSPPGQRQWSVPGVAVYDRPSWVGDGATLATRQFNTTTIIAGLYSLIVSLWIPFIAFGILPVLWIRVWLRRRRLHRAGAIPCRSCFYDLTGNTSGICPECGTAIGSESFAKGAN